MPIVLNKISKKYNDTDIFKDFTFEFTEGNIYVITGTVGIGKTTLLNIIASNTSIDSGEIIGLKEKKLSYLFQDNRLLKHKDVMENLRFVLEDKVNKSVQNNIIEKYLKMFGLYEYKNYGINELSGGMQKKLAIARALAFPNFNVLLLDEPFNNIDLQQKSNIMKLIKNNIPKETIVILVTHNVQDIQEFVDKIYVLDTKPIHTLSVKNIGD